MASYQIEWRSSARKELKRVPAAVVPHVVAAVSALSEDPHPAGCRKLRGSMHTYRIRIGITK